MKKVKLTTYAKLNDVTPRTVWNWIKKGLIKYERTETNRILIIQDEEYTPIKPPLVAVYARVSSTENKENLTNTQSDKQENKEQTLKSSSENDISQEINENGYLPAERYPYSILWHQSRQGFPVLLRYNPRYCAVQNMPG